MKNTDRSLQAVFVTQRKRPFRLAHTRTLTATENHAGRVRKSRRGLKVGHDSDYCKELCEEPQSRQMNEQNHESSESAPWYSDGLKFECTQCGNCCTGAPGAVWISDEELHEIADHLDKSIGEVRLMHTRIVRGKLSLREYANGDLRLSLMASRAAAQFMKPGRSNVAPGHSGDRT